MPALLVACWWILFRGKWWCFIISFGNFRPHFFAYKRGFLWDRLISWITQCSDFVWKHKTNDIWKRWSFCQNMFRPDGTNAMSKKTDDWQTISKKVVVMVIYVNCNVTNWGFYLFIKLRGLQYYWRSILVLNF